MSLFSVKDVRLSHILTVVPKAINRLKDYDWISPEERNQLENITGIKERRFAPKGTCASDFGTFLLDYFLRNFDWHTEDINVLVFVSQSRDYLLPNTACLIQSRAGLPSNCLAFDIPLGCSGYIYGLSVLSSLISASGGALKKGVLIAGDVSSYDLNYRDKSTYPLFGDALTLTTLEYDKSADPIHFNLQTDGKDYKALYIPEGGTRNPMSKSSFDEKEIENGIWRSAKNVVLDGGKIFEFSIKEVAKNVNALLSFAEIKTEDIEYFVFHQANRIMNETIRKQLKIDPMKYLYSLEKFSNTSSASIPLTLCFQIPSTSFNGTLCLAGFGVGLSWGSSLINCKKTIFHPLLDQ